MYINITTVYLQFENIEQLVMRVSYGIVNIVN